MLTLKEFQHILLLSESASVSEAAHRGAVSQPALSQSLANIEGKLGVQLFVRNRNALVPTKSGELLAARARQLLNQAASIREELQALREERTSAVRFAIGPLAASLFLEEAIVHFHDNHGGPMANFRVKFWDDLESELIENSISFFIGGFPAEHSDPRFAFRKFFEDRMVAVVRAGHPLARIRRPSITDFARYPAISYDSRRHYRFWQVMPGTTELELARRNLPASTMENPLAAMDIVARTDYTALLTDAGWRMVADRDRFVLLDLPDLRGAVHTYVVTNAGHVFSAAENDLVMSLEYARERYIARYRQSD